MNVLNSPYAQLRADIEQRPRASNVGELLDDAASRFADQPVLNFFEDDAALTFQELRAWSSRLATELRGRGVGVGTTVAVVLPNLPIFPVAWMALLRLGAVMVPVNPHYTSDEMRFVMSDAGVQFAVVHESTVEVARDAARDVVDTRRMLTWESTGLETFRVDGDRARLPDAADPMDWPSIERGDVAGIHYTSGTTGFPKGCVLTQDSWLVVAAVLDGVLPRRPRRILSDTPYFYMDAPMELMLALVSGAEQYVARRPSLTRGVRWIIDHDIDYAELWEIYGEKVVDADSEERLRQRPFTLMSSTYGLRAGARDELEQRMNAEIREFFGMSEIGIGMVEPFSHGVPDDGSCGHAAPFRETRVVSAETGFDVRDGEVGELWVRGRGVLLRYHNRPDANKDSFLDGWFRTGDLVTRVDGRHYLRGRIKDMIRRSHENIAAGEVESALSRSAEVAEVAVVGVPDALRGEEVKAFVVARPGARQDAATLEAFRAHAAEVLASFKVPRYLEFIAELPLTPSGKVSKAKLKELDPVTPPYGWDGVDNVERDR